jgi:hypothetical protein
MKITDTTDYIRQQQIGEFRSPQNPNDLFVYAINERLNTTEENKEYSIYIENENFATLRKQESANSLKLFDYDVGVKINTEKTSKTNKEENPNPQYDKTAKEQDVGEQGSLIDQWS